MVMGFAMTAGAATAVQVTLTSPTITKATATVCEKFGAVTFDFPPGAAPKVGDWWYMDLPTGSALCKNIDYLIVGNGATGVNTWVGTSTLDPTLVHFSNPLNRIGGGAPALDATGPLTFVSTGAAAVAPVITGNLALRVLGTSGSRRVTLYLAGDQGTKDMAAASNIDVAIDTIMRVKILDGASHVNTAATPANTSIILDRDGFKYTTISAQAGAGTTGNFRMYGEQVGDAGRTVAANEVINTALYVVPHVENTLCGNAFNHGNTELYVSFASKEDKFTFSGDAQIAHTGSGAAITLASCLGKTASTDEIKIGSQNSCVFDYETIGVAGAGNNYCTTHAAGEIYLQSSTTFGELDDRWDIQISSLTNGVYFGGLPTMFGLLASQDACSDGGTGIALTKTDYAVGGVWASTNAALLFQTTDSCTVGANNRVNVIKTYGGDITGIQNYKQISFNFADFQYDSSLVTANTEVDLQVVLSKYPCGEIWNGTITIGTFVSACATTSTATTTLFFPFLPGSSFAGWWGGYVIANGSGTAGTATLTATDVNGNSATFTTPSIPARGQFNASFLTVDEWTQAAANTAPFDGTQSYTVNATCNFTFGSGMAMLGNGTEGVGYTAYSSGW